MYELVGLRLVVVELLLDLLAPLLEAAHLRLERRDL